MSEQFTERDIKDRLMAVEPAALCVDCIVTAMANAEAGFVVWDMIPPAKETYANHRHTFMDAVHTGLAFCGTDTRDEWCVLGPMALVLMRSMPNFIQCEPVVCGPFVYVGKHRTTLVYTDARDRRPPRGGNEFVVGVGLKAARGLIQNSPTPFP